MELVSFSTWSMNFAKTSNQNGGLTDSSRVLNGGLSHPR